ncbi:C40 family peptidase [Pseudomonas sp.]|uniref:C40 family peptidase n=1 Tax=Pseudomonas sp. TaxID=306 RepID=UPI003FD77FBD
MDLDQSVIAAIYAHAAEENPKECCGLVVAVEGINRYVPLMNAADKPEQDFRISAESWADAEDVGEPVCVVHSHPGQSARLSGADRVSLEATELPWIIVEVREGKPVSHLVHLPTGYQAPLVGRPFHHGVLDCYTLVRDYYLREMSIELADYTREDGWWNGAEDHYFEKYAVTGFHQIDVNDLQQGDLVIMQVKSAKANHAGIYLADGKLYTEPDHHAVPGCILHHLYGRDSKRDVFGGYWRESARLYLRHKDAQPTK